MFSFLRSRARALLRATVTVSNLLLLLLIWRLADFIEEAGSGAIQMSLGDHHLYGWHAAAAQLFIIAALVLLCFATHRDTVVYDQSM